MLDDHLYPEDPEKSAAASLLMGVVGMGASQGLVARATKLAQKSSHTRPLALATARFGAIYTVAVSCVLVWRGTWVGWDCLYERWHKNDVKAVDKGHASKSGLLSHGTALTLLVTTGLFASVLAPPAQVSVLRDFAVRGGRSMSSYQGPAQSMVDSLFSSSRGRLSSTRTLSTAKTRGDGINKVKKTLTTTSSRF